MKISIWSANHFRSLPLKTKAKAVSIISCGVLFAFFFSCTAALSYYNYSFKRLFDTSYLQSDAMTRMSELSRAVAVYESAPTRETRELVADSFARGWALFERFPDDPRQQSEESRMLKTAILRTYGTYERKVQELFALGSRKLHTTDYYLKYYEIVEIGDYVDTYLEQLIQENLRESNALYRRAACCMRLRRCWGCCCCCPVGCCFGWSVGFPGRLSGRSLRWLMLHGHWRRNRWIFLMCPLWTVTMRSAT